MELPGTVGKHCQQRFSSSWYGRTTLQLLWKLFTTLSTLHSNDGKYLCFTLQLTSTTDN